MLRIEQRENHAAQVGATAPLLATGWWPKIKLSALRPPTIRPTPLWQGTRQRRVPSLADTALGACILVVALLPEIH